MPEERISTQSWLILLVLSLGLAIVMIDATIVNVAIPSIQKDFGASLKDVEWVNSIYSLVYAALIVTWGRVGDQVGRKRIFMVGIGIFVLGSMMVGAAPTIGFMILGRVVQGVGASMSSPSTLSLVSSSFTGRARGVAFGVWGAVAGAAGALGPLLGGWLTTNASWNWAFYINLPIGIVAVTGAYFLIRESKAESAQVNLDVPGIVLAALGIGGIVFGLIEGQAYGWWAPKQPFTVGGWRWPLENLSIVPFSFAVGIGALAVFVWWEQKLSREGREPLFDLALLRFESFRYGLITAGILALGQIGLVFIMSLYLQAAMGLTAFDTGLTFLPFALVTLVVAPSAGMLAARIGPKWVVTGGMLVTTAAMLVLSQVLSVDTPRSTIVLILMFYGLGMGLAMPQLTNVVLSQVPTQRIGAGSGANNTMFQVGAALGIAVLGAALTSQITASAKDQVRANPVFPEPMKVALVEALDQGTGMEAMDGMDTSMMEELAGQEGMPAGMSTGMGDGSEAPGSGTSASAEEGLFGRMMEGAAASPGLLLGTIMKEAFVSGTRAAALIASLFMGLGMLSSLFIPNVKQEARGKMEPVGMAG